jgi:hypothetical protein
MITMIQNTLLNLPHHYGENSNEGWQDIGAGLSPSYFHYQFMSAPRTYPLG